ncbi:GNAT family N-acetyltransferase [Salinarimonas rosea]|uniref:GNAT family N-acetyltransferase n=1 Tax=Salinarimonas rosea TaxID=552063 RepID=UPI0003F7F7B0|nr:GNAT family N-acetyltransferase [Salinarimonas rosea]
MPAQGEAAAVVQRAPAPGEIEDLRAIDVAARARYREAGGPLAFVAETPAIAAERFARGETLVAEIHGRPSGYVLLEPLDGLIYVASIAVAPEAGGRGVGRDLMRAAEIRAVELGLAGTSLATFRVPPWNGPWFRRLGYAPLPEAAIGPGLAAILAGHAAFLDMATRELLWKPCAPAVAGDAA